MKAQILIIDDDRMVCQSLELLFKRKGYAVKSVHTPYEALQELEQQTVNLVMLDMNFSITTTGKQGLETLQKILDLRPGIPVILMTGWATVQLAVNGMKIGAHDFIAKPWDNQTILASVKTALTLKGNLPITADKLPFERIITQSPVMEQLLATAQRVAATDAAVLITGESGTGKELVAEAIHSSSLRSSKPFVAVNLGGVPESLFESELFGHKAGAFTDAIANRKGRFELAEGGTLFLDEVGDLPLANQVKLLRVLQERRYARLGESKERNADIRLISATSRQLSNLVQTGAFREDLLYRINLIHLHLPPLRERSGDVVLLAQHFLNKAAERYERGKMEFTTTALDWLQRQPFPGNIRQLQNLIERVAILAQGNSIDTDDLQQFASGGSSQNALNTSGKTLAEVEKILIKQSLLKHRNNITATAAELGITRAALYRRLEKFGIRYDD